MATGTTDTAALVKAFEGHKYDGFKAQPCYYRACDHQAIQQAYVGMLVPKKMRRSPDEYFAIVSSVGGEFAAESCSNPDSAAATKIFDSQKIPARADYTPVKF